MAKTVAELEALMIAHMPKFAELENKAMRACFAEERTCSYCGDEFRGAGWQRYCGAECQRDAARDRAEARAA